MSYAPLSTILALRGLSDGRNLWGSERIERHVSAARADNIAKGIDTRRFVRIGGQGAKLTMRGHYAAPPIMGGSPYATRNTGWHADGCLCRRCAA
jgi:hypothetical protein